MKPWRVVSFYTHGNGYEQEVKKLLESLNLFKVPHTVASMPPFPSWTTANRHKAEFIETMLQNCPENIVWIDADGIVRKYPALFDDLCCDVAAHIRPVPMDGRPNHLLGGTMYFANNDRVKTLVANWKHACNLTKGKVWESELLHRLLDRSPEVKFYDLPPAYTLIFDSMQDQGEPVIEHFQASRRLRDDR